MNFFSGKSTVMTDTVYSKLGKSRVRVSPLAIIAVPICKDLNINNNQIVSNCICIIFVLVRVLAGF